MEETEIAEIEEAEMAPSPEEVPAEKSSIQGEALDTETIKALQKQRTNVETDEFGRLAPKNLDEQYRAACAYHKSRMLPDRFTSPEMILTAVQMALELDLKPLTGIRQIAVIKGTPALFGDLPLALAMRSGLIEEMDEFLFDEEGNKIDSSNPNGKVFGACTKIKRRGLAIREAIFTLDDAIQAGLYPDPKPSKPWNKYTKDMLKYRARTRCLKDTVPDALNGMAVAEFDFNERPDNSGNAVKELTSREKVNARYGSKKDS